MEEAEGLRQQLRDEAAWRAFVEEELAREAEKARVWRERAEARATRIDRLVSGRSLRQALATRLAGPRIEALRRPDAEDAADAALSVLRPSPTPSAPAHPEVRAATLLSDATLGAIAAEFDNHAITGEDALRDADVALIDDEAWHTAEPTIRTQVTTWLELPERPPVLWIGRVATEVAERLGARDALVGGETSDVMSLTLAPWASPTPAPTLPRDGARGRWVEDGDARVLATEHGPGLAISTSPHRSLGFALAGVPVVAPRGGAPDGLPAPGTRPDVDALGTGAPLPPSLRRLAIQQRRAVASAATAAHRATEVLEALGVPHVAASSRMAALLSSNRPDSVPGQLARLGRQLRQPDEVRCALHGGATAQQLRAVEAAADEAGLLLTVTEPDQDVPLGTVLNDLAAATGAELLAKIDDDDHYGPAHLLDAIAGLERTGADLVGKKAHYVHLTSRNRTWLLAEGAEDTWVEQGLMGATFVWRHGLHERVRFLPRPRRVDSLFVRAAAAAGARLYALPANDFAYVRNPGGRTNVAGSDYVQARGRDIGSGLPLDVVDV